MSNRLRYEYAPETETADSWMRQANCLDQDPELFFPIGKTGSSVHQIQDAKAVCSECPVRIECLNKAVSIDAEGIWGGTTEDDRRAMKRSQRRQKMASRSIAEA